MNEQKDRARFHRAIDRTLSGLPEDPFLVSRIAARTAESGEGERMRNCRFVMIMALIVVLSLCTVAVASELLSGTVDWDGNVVEEEQMVFPSPSNTPVSDQVDRTVLLSKFQDAHQPEAGEAVAIYDLMEGDVPLLWDSVPRGAQTMETFTAMMAEAGHFPLPINIPEGYRFFYGHVYYGCKPDGEYRLIETVESEDGFRAERYVLDDENAVVTGYSLSFRKETETYDHADPKTWNMIEMDVSLASDVENTEMYIHDSIEVLAVDVPGMTKALAIRNERRNVMEMYAQLEQPVSYHSSHSVEVKNDQIWVSIWSDANMEETIGLFGGK